MLRQYYLNKYKDKPKFGMEKFIKDDEEYLLNQSRPIKERFIGSLSQEKVNKFIDDVLTNKEITSVLYDSNAKIEINKYLKNKNNILHKKINLKKINNFNSGPSSFERRRRTIEAYYNIKDEISSFYLSKEKYTNKLNKKNNKNMRKIKKDLAIERQEFSNELKNNKIKGFERAYFVVKNKLEYYRKKENSQNNSSNKLEFNSSNEINQSIILPSARLNKKNVYNRLYNNIIFLSPNKKKIKNSFSFCCLKRHNSVTNIKIPNIKLNLKNVLKTKFGKEFTIKITNNTLRKCLKKYSGGPRIIKNNRDQKKIINKKIENSFQNNDDFKDNYYVDYYKLINKRNGNSFLHSASNENCPELVKYFIEKNSNINLQNYKGDTPLHIALKNKNKEIIKLLIDNKALLDIPNNKGDIPYDLFSMRMKKEFGIENLLIKNSNKNKYYI